MRSGPFSDGGRLDNTPILSDALFMGYPGGKNAAGVYQKIINLMPPHQVYIEPFLGGGAIMRLKRPAKKNVGLDLDLAIIWRRSLETAQEMVDTAAEIGDGGSSHAENADGRPAPETALRSAPSKAASADVCNFHFECQDGIKFLAGHCFNGSELVYCDPPYLLSTRGNRRIYRYELTDSQHRRLLNTIKKLPCMVMISGYWSEMYAEALKGWNSISFEAMTRGGHTATEWLWYNFPEPVALHDYRFLGKNFRERERIKRKKLRWVNRLERMPLLERRALLSAIADTPGFDDTISARRSGERIRQNLSLRERPVSEPVALSERCRLPPCRPVRCTAAGLSRGQPG